MASVSECLQMKTVYISSNEHLRLWKRIIVVS